MCENRLLFLLTLCTYILRSQAATYWQFGVLVRVIFRTNLGAVCSFRNAAKLALVECLIRAHLYFEVVTRGMR